MIVVNLLQLSKQFAPIDVHDSVTVNIVKELHPFKTLFPIDVTPLTWMFDSDAQFSKTLFLIVIGQLRTNDEIDLPLNDESSSESTTTPLSNVIVVNGIDENVLVPIDDKCMFEGMMTVFMFGAFPKTEDVNAVNESGIVKEVNRTHPAKQLDPMLDNLLLLTNEMEVNLLQFSNPFDPNEVQTEGIKIVCRDVHPLNALSPIDVTPSIWMLDREEHPLKALLEMTSGQFNVNDVIGLLMKAESWIVLTVVPLPKLIV